MKKKLLIILGFMVVVLIILYGFVLLRVSNTKKLIQNLSSQTGFSVDGDWFSSIAGVVGRRELLNFDYEEKEKVIVYTYRYKDVEYPSIDIRTFVAHLVSEENFIVISDADFTKNTGVVQLAAKSKTPGKIIRLRINWNEKNYQIMIEKGKGKIELINE